MPVFVGIDAFFESRAQLGQLAAPLHGPRHIQGSGGPSVIR
jgi:hypothetical protein